MKTKQRDYKALLTVHGLDTMKSEEITQLKKWLKKCEISIGKQQYARVARFRLMK